MPDSVPYSIRRLADGEEAVWDAFVDAQEEATLYHRSPWRRLIEDQFGHQTVYLYAAGTNGDVQGVLPLVRLKSRLFGDYMVSMPYVNYGGGPGVDTGHRDRPHAGGLSPGRGSGHQPYRIP